MIRKYVQYFKNMLKYVKSGGVVYVNVKQVLPSEQFTGKKVLITMSADKPSVTYDEKLSADSDIIFDDAGNAVSYTVKDKSSKEAKFITVDIK